MNLDHTILSVIIFTPLVGALLLALLPNRAKTQRGVALAITLLTLLFTLHLPVYFNPGPIVAGSSPLAHHGHGFAFEQNAAWIASPAIRYHLGVDGLSLWLVVLTGFLAPLGVLASWRIESINSRPKLFYVLFLLQQVAMLGVFVSLDLFLYYAFWELALVPMTLLIATFGRTHNRRRSALRYFLYAFIPSAFLLVGMLWLYTRTGTFDLPTLQQLAAQHLISSNSAALWLASLAFLLAFAVKVPIFPLHGWLADAIVDAPTAAVMVLAGKLGLYSILRFSFGIFPEQSFRIAPLMIALGALGIVYGACIALVQRDLKRLAAFATLSALSFIVLGAFSFTVSGVDGAIYQILNESLAGAALFLLLGMLFERYGTYDMRDLGGIAAFLPWMVTMFVVTTLALIGLPMLNSFVGEVLILSGSMQTVYEHHVFWTVIATTGVILSAAYMLWMIQRVFYGETGFRTAEVQARDLTAREHITMWPLAILFLAMGVASPFWLRAIDPAGVRIATTVAALTGRSIPELTRLLNRPCTPGVPVVLQPALDANGHLIPTPTQSGFVDPNLAAAALCQPAPPPNPGARY